MYNLSNLNSEFFSNYWWIQIQKSIKRGSKQERGWKEKNTEEVYVQGAKYCRAKTKKKKRRPRWGKRAISHLKHVKETR